ncbi:MAG TPA: YbaB/EbfC family nucleoid-associated protein [Glycomyces sp.]|nr:YbaB/EbfC family nucleoid-associated protein [Glycomyces sp.]
MPSVFEDPEGYMRDFQGRMESLVARASTLNEALEAAAATATSPDGEVTVTVGVGGALKGLELAPEVRKMSAQSLAALIQETYAEAAMNAGRASTDALASAFGEDSEVVRQARAATTREE